MALDKNKIANGIYRVNAQETRLMDGVWKNDAAANAYLVSDQSKLASITDASPGDVAYTAGFVLMWMLDTDGTSWVPCG